jgi:site-specific DNA-methyltransferase (cytosine-N4-specific)
MRKDIRMQAQAIQRGANSVGTGCSHLQCFDFDFAESKTVYLTHGLHPYPAKFIPQIPAALIGELSCEGDVVADIFCGSGTTLAEALLHGRNALGFDANPLACLISMAKTSRFHPGDKRMLLDLIDRAKAQAEEIATAGAGLYGRWPAFVSRMPRPDSETLGFWFDQCVTEELAEIVSWCRALPSETARTVALVAFSSIVVAVSRQDSDTRYVRREKNVAPGGAMARFAKALKSSVGAVSDFGERAKEGLTCDVRQANLLDDPPSPMFDLMVCSPPYPNAFSYHLYHMTRMLWLGMDQPRFKRVEIGSHRKYSSKGTGAATAATFRAEMRAILAWLNKHLKNNGFACFVVGDSTIRGELVNNSDIIAEAGVMEGFAEVARPTRTLRPTKKAFNPVIGKIKQERILILQNRG